MIADQQQRETRESDGVTGVLGRAEHVNEGADQANIALRVEAERGDGGQVGGVDGERRKRPAGVAEVEADRGHVHGTGRYRGGPVEARAAGDQR